MIDGSTRGRSAGTCAAHRLVQIPVARELWRLLNRERDVDRGAVWGASLALFIIYAIITVIRHVPGQPAIVLLHAVVLVYAVLGIATASRMTWRGLRAYTVGLALLLPSTTAAQVYLHGNHPSDLALTALGFFAPTVFLVSAIDVLVVVGVLSVASIAWVAVLGPPGVPLAVAGIVIGGALVSGAAAALVLVAFRARIAESTAWWQQACARERVLREFIELAAPHLGDEVLAREFAARFHRAFGTGFCAVVLLDGQAGTPRVVATSGVEPPSWPGPSTPKAPVAGGWTVPGALLAAAADRQPLVRERLTRDVLERFAGLPGLVEGGTMVALPIVRDDAVAGMVILSAAHPRAIAPEDLLLWRAMAHQVGVAIGSARLFTRLQQALRGRTEFVNTMSHELRSPLHVLLGYTEMLAEGRQERGFIAARMRVSALELLQLVESTLAAARLDTGKVRVQPSEFALGDLIPELRESIGALPEAENGVPVRWEIPASLPVVRLDRLKTKEIVHNLISNALKFTEHGEIVVRFACEQDRVRVDVEDTGQGIAPDAQARIFEMFERLESNRGPRAAGAGLGLYIVRSLAQMMNGSVTLTSEPGRGSRFTVWLPIRIG